MSGHHAGIAVETTAHRRANHDVDCLAAVELLDRFLSGRGAEPREKNKQGNYMRTKRTGLKRHVLCSTTRLANWILREIASRRHRACRSSREIGLPSQEPERYYAAIQSSHPAEHVHAAA